MNNTLVIGSDHEWTAFGKRSRSNRRGHESIKASDKKQKYESKISNTEKNAKDASILRIGGKMNLEERTVDSFRTKDGKKRKHLDLSYIGLSKSRVEKKVS